MFRYDWIFGLDMFIPRLASIALNWGDWLAWLCKAEKVDTSWFSIDPIWPNAERIPAEKLGPLVDAPACWIAWLSLKNWVLVKIKSRIKNIYQFTNQANQQ